MQALRPLSRTRQTTFRFKEVNMTFGEILKFYRQLSFISQTELSAASGIAQYRLSRLENNTSTPTEDEVKVLGKTLGVSIDELLYNNRGNTVERYLRDKLALGHENGVPEEVIMHDLNLTERALRKKIQRERIGGALICHNYDEHGYYIAVTATEKNKFLRRHMAVIRTLSRECKPFRDDLKANGETPCA